MDAPLNQQVILCSECFTDEGLRLTALMWGADKGSACPNCREGRWSQAQSRGSITSVLVVLYLGKHTQGTLWRRTTNRVK